MKAEAGAKRSKKKAATFTMVCHRDRMMCGPSMRKVPTMTGKCELGNNLRRNAIEDSVHHQS
jgi:hypothetical protein